MSPTRRACRQPVALEPTRRDGLPPTIEADRDQAITIAWLALLQDERLMVIVAAEARGERIDPADAELIAIENAVASDYGERLHDAYVRIARRQPRPYERPRGLSAADYDEWLADDERGPW
jgi:hypothetical protein